MVLRELHEGHPGISRMRALSRMYVWWPGIYADIEKSVRTCAACQEVQSSPPPAPLHPWKWPSRPWARLHLDFAGPFENRMFLVLIDAHSKWIEAFCVQNATSRTVISELRPVFARFGVPETVVTDNGTCFVSEEFEQFLTSNGIKHYTSAPYHPASNGLAERAVQIIKRGLRKDNTGDLRVRLSRTLLNYRMTPQATTGVSPAELLLGRRPRTRLDLVKPHTAERVEDKQNQQKAQHDQRARSREFKIGDPVFVKNFGPGRKWLSGNITKVTGPVSYLVKLEGGRRTLSSDSSDLETEPQMSDVAILLSTAAVDSPSPESEDRPTSSPVATTPEYGETPPAPV